MSKVEIDIAVADADSEEASGTFCAVRSVQRKWLVVTFYAELPSLRFQHTEKAAFLQRRERIIRAKPFVCYIERRGMCAQALADFDVLALVQKQQHAVVLLLKTVALCLCAVADGDFVVAAYQSIQSFQKPQENALGFVFEDLAIDERIVRAVGLLRLCLQNELPPLEALGQIVERLQGEIAEADEAHIRLDLIILHELLLCLNGRFVGDEVLERPRIFERALAQVVVDEQQLVFDVRHTEGRLQNADTLVVAVEIAQYAVKDRAQHAFSFAAVADNDKRLLQHGSRKQAVTAELLQGYLIVGKEHVVQIPQEPLGLRSVGVVTNRKAVDTEFLFFAKHREQSVFVLGQGAVLKVQFFKIRLRRLHITVRFDAAQQLFRLVAVIGFDVIHDLVTDDLPRLAVLDRAVYRIELVVDTAHLIAFDKA